MRLYLWLRDRAIALALRSLMAPHSHGMCRNCGHERAKHAGLTGHCMLTTTLMDWACGCDYYVV